MVSPQKYGFEVQLVDKITSVKTSDWYVTRQFPSVTSTVMP